MYKLVIIANPNAKKGKAKKNLSFIIEYFLTKGQKVAAWYTEKEGDAVNLAQKACDEGFDIVIAAGGDGTVNECADGIMRSQTKAKLGIIPIGRGNDFAYVAKIPTNIKKACDLILKGEAKPIDVGFIKDCDHQYNRYFLNGAGFGFEPSVNFKASSYKHLNGMPSYIMAFFYILIHTPKPIKTKIEADGQTFMINTQQISVCNGRRMGSSFIMAPNGVIDDGVLDLVFANAPITGPELLRYAFRFFFGTQLRTKKFEEQKVKKVIVSAASGMPVHADGEKISYDTKVCSIEIKNKALEIFHNC